MNAEILDKILLLKKETEWIEFKVNNEKPEMIGEYISALANSASLHNIDKAYLIYGIENTTFNAVGTNFKPKSTKVKNEELENWLHKLLEPQVDFTIHELRYKNVLISANALRKDEYLYPEIAIRELIANALIHQDFTISGTSPMIEIYENRMEITNSGKPLIDVLRLIDCQPKSRNEKLANTMRLMGICEERGSGIDKVINATEVFQLPAPNFTAEDDYFKVALFAPLQFEDMDKQDRIRAAYQHCCLKFLSNEYMTNSTLRKRFALSDKQHSIASKIISHTLESGYIKPADPENKSTKHMKYVPFFG